MKKELTEKEKWAFSILSDAQEEIAIGNKEIANDKINDAKRVLMGKYDKQSYGSIAIIRGRIQPLAKKVKQDNHLNISKETRGWK